MPVVRLQSSDGKFFNVDVEIARVSVTIRNMLQRMGDNMEQEKVVRVAMANTTGDILERVIAWATHHKDDSVGDIDNAIRTDNISVFDIEFLNVDHGTLMQLSSAAHHLGIKGLLELTSKALANIIKGKTHTEIRKIFNIQNNFEAGEEEQIQRENEWDK